MAEPPSEKELELIESLKTRVKDLSLSPLQSHPSHLLRWLRARDLDLKKAENMLRESMKWRKENKIDSILKWKPNDFILNNFTYEITGFTKENLPVAFAQGGRWDIKKAVDLGYRDEFIRNIFKLYEKVCNEMIGKINPRTNLPVTQLIMVCDFEHYSYGQLRSLGAVSALLQSANQFDLNFPETFKACYIIKAPAIFALLFSLIKPLLSASTLGKIEIFDSKEENWKVAINKVIPTEAIPLFYGGTCTKSIINQYDVRGADLSESYLSGAKSNGDSSGLGNHEEVEDVDDAEDIEIENLTTTFKKFENFAIQDKDLLCEIVKAGCKLMVEIEVLADFAILSWCFKTEFYDIGFSLLDETKEIELVPYTRVNCQNSLQNGTYICDKPGKYFLCFDNTYSFMREKNVHYSVKMD